jgi:hypothetical protein
LIGVNTQDFGNYTCEGYPGSQYHIELDAQTFAAWDVDYLKLDACNSYIDDQPAGNHYTSLGEIPTEQLENHSIFVQRLCCNVISLKQNKSTHCVFL